MTLHISYVPRNVHTVKRPRDRAQSWFNRIRHGYFSAADRQPNSLLNSVSYSCHCWHVGGKVNASTVESDHKRPVMRKTHPWRRNAYRRVHENVPAIFIGNLGSPGRTNSGPRANQEKCIWISKVKIDRKNFRPGWNRWDLDMSFVIQFHIVVYYGFCFKLCMKHLFRYVVEVVTYDESALVQDMF